jgi:hypothetical protein
MARVVLHYFPPNTKHPSGHVALTIPNGMCETNYLSFASGEGLVTSVISENQGRANLVQERHIYGTEITVILPDCPEAFLQEAINEFSQLHREDYHSVIKNNAQVVTRFLQQLGYVPLNEEFSKAEPQDVAQRACMISLNNIERHRKNYCFTTS